jgi:transposase
MSAYSQDLREKVMAAVAAGKQSNRAIAETFGISESTIEKWTRRLRETGSVAAKPHAGGHPRVLAAHAARIRQLIDAQPDISHAELCAQLKAETGVRANTSMMVREVQRLNLPRKKSRSTTVRVSGRT